MDVAESIKTAWEAVEQSGVPEHMQKLAFREALRSLLGTSAPSAKNAAHTPPAPPGGKGDQSDGDNEAGDAVDESAVYAAVAEETGVPVEKLEQVFHVDNGVVKLLGASTKYGGSTAEKARNIALIVTVVRKVGMGRGDTSFDVLKDACNTKHAYDSKNWAPSHMTSVTGCVVKGDGSTRRLEAKGAGVTAFPDVIDKVLGTS